jgi:hypothetical protein
MEGMLSGAVGHLSTLVVLDLGKNFLEGELPRGLSQLGALQKLDLSSNR